MSRRTLVAYDGSSHAERALKFALTTRTDGERIVLLQVVEPFADHTEAAGFGSETVEERLAARRAELESVIPDGADDIETATRYDRPARGILDYADRAGVDTIVMGSRGTEGVKRLLLGSVAETVVRRAEIPVTVVRASGQDPEPGAVLVPFDGSEQSRSALVHAFSRFDTAEVTVLFVLSPHPQPASSPVDEDDPFADPADWGAQWSEHAVSVLDQAREIADAHGRTVETAYVAGDPASEILDFVPDSSVEHIVMGSTGRGGLERLLLGSVTETVLRRSPASVTVVR